MTAALDPATSRFADLVARAIRVTVVANVMDFNGHVSARDESDPNLIWINNRHASRSTIMRAEIVPFDIQAGRRIGDGIEPPSEWHIHAEIYKRRPDVHGIMHSHPEFIRTLSVVGQPLRPVDGVGSFLPEDGAPVLDTPVLINTPARGVAVATALGDAPVLVLRQHGAVAVGFSVEQAVIRMICSEQNAKMQYQAIQIGEPRYLQGEELKAMAAESNHPHATTKFWTYYEQTSRKMGAFEGL
jgi:L-fuculose-phosphate aldolase